MAQPAAALADGVQVAKAWQNHAPSPQSLCTHLAGGGHGPPGWLCALGGRWVLPVRHRYLHRASVTGQSSFHLPWQDSEHLPAPRVPVTVLVV